MRINVYLLCHLHFILPSLGKEVGYDRLEKFSSQLIHSLGSRLVDKIKSEELSVLE